jgi:hypothetical protein
MDKIKKIYTHILNGDLPSMVEELNAPGYDIQKIRRRIEDHLRKLDDPQKILTIADFLGVRKD